MAAQEAPQQPPARSAARRRQRRSQVEGCAAEVAVMIESKMQGPPAGEAQE